MSKTRDNHYVPRWYQRGFLEDGRSTLKYLHLRPKQHTRGDGTRVPGRSLFDSEPARCFHQLDLYSTRLGFEINDEIERRLFGAIDGKGKPAVEAFKRENIEERIRHFENFFEYVDAQKLRTPKGLDWLRRHYPFIDDNELLFEMQGVRRMHCTLWAEGVREVVSAEDSDVKFIVSDHPVTVYNHAAPPTDQLCAYPNDPLIAWKGSQTIFPLDRNFCLILTNLEYAQDPYLLDPCSKRTNARYFGQSLIRRDTLIQSRCLDAREVTRINHVLKSRATDFLAAGREEWLHPERELDGDWSSLRSTLLPPKDELWKWGGETYVGYKDGSSSYQDQFGRSEPGGDELKKSDEDHPKRGKDPCGCGSGRVFQSCCATRPAALRPSWTELSIRERNILHANTIANILGMYEGKDWTQVRRELTDEKIAAIYRVFRALWPPDTDIMSLLPKPDGRLRALFTGLVDPRMTIEFATGASNYFGEILIQNPFMHAARIAPEHDPTKVPEQYRLEVLKNVKLLLELMPLIDAGVVNFFPDPCHFDPHLRSQMIRMAEVRTDGTLDEIRIDARTKWMKLDDYQRAQWSRSEAGQRASIRHADPDITDEVVEAIIRLTRDNRHLDPLASLMTAAPANGGWEGQIQVLFMVPNFEISLFLAQATGSVIVTDSPFRWEEFRRAARCERGRPPHALPTLKAAIEGVQHLFASDPQTIAKLHRAPQNAGYAALMRDAFRYLSASGRDAAKPNWESQLPKRFAQAHLGLQRAIRATGSSASEGRVKCIIPTLGIRDNTINRLLLMSSVDRYMESVPMAFFFEPADPEYRRVLPSTPRTSHD